MCLPQFGAAGRKGLLSSPSSSKPAENGQPVLLDAVENKPFDLGRNEPSDNFAEPRNETRRAQTGQNRRVLVNGGNPVQVLNIPTADGNPYQRNLMYRCAADRVAFVGGGKGALLRLDAARHPVTHLHWDDRLFGRDTDAQKNADLLHQAEQSIDNYRAQGGRLVWTIHNARPHKVISLDGFRQARQSLVQRADVIHVHAPHARDHMISEYGTDPSRIHVIPHPSYLGSYEPQEVTLARAMTDRNPTTFLFFGMFRGEKGAERIRDVAAKLTKRDYDYSLNMYGKAFGSQRRLLRRLGWNENISLRTNRIPDVEVPEIFSNAHFYLSPYSELFSSGTVSLALSFGLPIIGPALREMKEITPPELHETTLYDPDMPRGLIRAMVRSLQMETSEYQKLRQACLNHAQTHAPEVISPRLMKILLEQQPDRPMT